MIPVVTEIVGEQEMLRAFGQLEEIYSDLSPVFEAVGEEALSNMQHRIENHPGPGLKEATIKRKGHSRILRDTDGLYASFFKGEASNVFRVGPRQGEFGSSIEYGIFHQEGKKVPKRTIIEVTSEHEAQYNKIASDVQLERIKALGFEVRA